MQRRHLLGRARAAFLPSLALAIAVWLLGRVAHAQAGERWSSPPTEVTVEAPPDAEVPTRLAWLLSKESRELAGHRFIPQLLQPTPFVTTHFGVRQGFTMLVVPDVALALGKDTLQASGFTQAFDVGVRLTDFLGLYAAATGTVTAGTNAPSALEIGGDVEGGFELGGIFRLARFERTGTQIALRFSGGMAFEGDLNVAQFVESAQQASGQSLASARGNQALALLVTPSRARVLGGSLIVAQTLARPLGLQASVSYARSKTTLRPFDLDQRARVDETSDNRMVRAAFALNIDGSPYRVPLALMPEYQVTHESVHNVDDDGNERDLSYASHRAALGIYYSGRENLVLGVGGIIALNLEQDRLEWSAADGSPRKSGAPSERQVQFVLRYIW